MDFYKKFEPVILNKASPLLRVDLMINYIKKSFKSNSSNYYTELVL